jgi:PHP domain
LPPDSHVHSEWSWDAAAGAMRQTCARAVELGLPAVAFTEHADFTPWTIELGEHELAGFPEHWARWYDDGVFTPPEFDLLGYQACLAACREAFPGLRILSGVEVGEPHWYAGRTRELLAAGRFDRVLASVHARPDGAAFRGDRPGFLPPPSTGGGTRAGRQSPSAVTPTTRTAWPVASGKLPRWPRPTASARAGRRTTRGRAASAVVKSLCGRTYCGEEETRHPAC